MKRFFVCTILLMCTLVGRAQKHDLLDFIFNPPWTLSAEEVLLNYPGLEDLPLLEALYPPAELLYAFPEENITFSGFTYAGHDAFVIIPHNEPSATFDNFLAIISPETTMGDDNKGVFLITLQTLGSALGAPVAENSIVDDLGGGIKVHIEDVWQSDGALFAPFYMTMDIYGSAPALYGFMVNRPYEEAPAEVAPAEAVESAEAVEVVEAVEGTSESTMEEFEKSMTTLDNNANHMHFRGVSFNQTAEEFCAELEKLGYTHHPEYTPLAATSAPRAIMQGEYGGFVCDVYVYCTPTSGKVFYVRLLLQYQNSWGELWSEYEIFKRRLTNIYGEPEVEEVFSDLYGVGTGLEIEGIKRGLNNIISTFTIDTDTSRGYIQLSIQADEEDAWVNLAFYDYFNLILRESEYEAMMM